METINCKWCDKTFKRDKFSEKVYCSLEHQNKDPESEYYISQRKREIENKKRKIKEQEEKHKKWVEKTQQLKESNLYQCLSCNSSFSEPRPLTTEDKKRIRKKTWGVGAELIGCLLILCFIPVVQVVAILLMTLILSILVLSVLWFIITWPFEQFYYLLFPNKRPPSKPSGKCPKCGSIDFTGWELG